MSFGNTLLGSFPQKRRVFFSFHYQNDIWRVNQVRNSWRFQHERQREAEGFFDASIWESSKRTSDDSLKALIREGIKNTSVTCILSGTETHQRRWVRYEIARSIVKKNGLLVVKIHKMKDKSGYDSSPGENPLDYMGVYKADDDRILLAEKVYGKWIRYKDYTQSVVIPPQWRKPTSNSVIKLSSYARSYCYVGDNGTVNFPAWVRHAAKLGI